MSMAYTDHSTGCDGVRIWDVDTLREIITPPRRQRVVGKETTIELLTIRNNPCPTLCFVTALGYLGFWRQCSKEVFEELTTRKIGGGKEILSIETDKPTASEVLFAVGSLCGQVQLWRFDSNGPSNIYAVTIGTTVPRKVAFSQTMASSKSRVKAVIVYGFYDGLMYGLLLNRQPC